MFTTMWNKNHQQSIHSHKKLDKDSNYYVISYQADFCVKHVYKISFIQFDIKNCNV